MVSLIMYLIPASLALLIKGWLLVKSDKRELLVNNWPLAAFFVAITVFNVIEVLTYSMLAPASAYPVFIKWYNGALVLATGFLLVLAIRIADVRLAGAQIMTGPLAVFTLGFFVAIVSTDWFVTGYTRVNYGFSRIPGDYNFLMQYFAMAAMALTISVLVAGSFRQRGKGIKKKKALHVLRCRVLLLSFMPFIACIVALVVLMQFGVPVTGAIVLPLTTTYLLLVLIFTETRKQLFNLLDMVRVPYTPEGRTYNQINHILLEFLSETSTGKQKSMKSLSKDIESRIVSLMLKKAAGRQSSAAGMLGVSPSTVNRKKSAMAAKDAKDAGDETP